MKRGASQSKMTHTLKRTKTRARTAPYTQKQRHLSGPRFIKLRYKVASAATISIDGIDLIAACGTMSTSTTSARTLYESAKLSYIKVVGTPPTAGNINEVKMEFGTGSFSTTASRDVLANSSNNPNVGPNLFARPRAQTPASDWFTTSTPNLVSIVAPIQTIIEVGLMVMDFETGQTATALAGTYTGVGQFTKRSPDAALVVL